ncbi:unnamed protein product [Kuraishia capsulata CBS 1993]|uniref:F-box domain-containing protein n=1 Tax=Kuraishia capsulata CBS 1993 TaxID=1382522 RepID=W6MY41_9ASCO|nr:uncharacterized protein KUCA_T00005970001 [Kuraishia capsulata CBS 1993]CDK29975.1 unnamed protein product [Kuraishia capsulata CBS 1993]
MSTSKRKKLSDSSDLLALLPLEIYQLIIPRISKTDLVNCSSTSRSHRRKLEGNCFQECKIPWDAIDTFLESSLDKSQCEQVRLYLSTNLTNSKKAEWNDLYKLLSKLKELRSLVLETSSSSIFLKYQPLDEKQTGKVADLSLVSQFRFAKFEISHLRCFPQISSLSLQNFQICKDMFDFQDYRFPNLTSLQLANCTWEFPVGLHLIFPCKLQKLVIQLDDSHSNFTLSERFLSLLKFHKDRTCNEEYYSHLKHLEIEVKGKYQPFCNWLQAPCAGLTTLKLLGWKLNSLGDLDAVFKDKFPNLEMLEMSISNEMDLARCRSKLQRLLPEARIKLRVSDA